VNRILLALLAFFVVGSALGQAPPQAKIRITTWNMEWFPNGSPHDVDHFGIALVTAFVAFLRMWPCPSPLFLHCGKRFFHCLRVILQGPDSVESRLLLLLRHGPEHFLFCFRVIL
jgi:hypothetical protein